mgnify:CR=1 FL=1
MLQVKAKFEEGVTWDKAMDEIRCDRWEKKYKHRALEAIIRYWPDTEKYKDKPELIASLEPLVCYSMNYAMMLMLISNIKNDNNKNCYDFVRHSKIREKKLAFAMFSHNTFLMFS